MALIFILFYFIYIENSNNERQEHSSSAERRTESPYSTTERDTKPPPMPNSEGKNWNYPNIDLMTSGALWHNYSGLWKFFFFNNSLV